MNTISIVVRIAGGLLASVMTARFLGPAGMALTGNLRNFLTSLDTFSTLGFQNGIIKYAAQHNDNQQKLYHTLATIFFAILMMILVLIGVIFILSENLGQWIFGSSQYQWVFQMVAFSLPWYTGNLVFIAILNGLGKYKKVISITIWGNVSGVLLSALMIWQFGITGAFLGLVVCPSLMFLFSFYLIYRTFPGLPFLRWKYFDFYILRGLFSYSGMSIISAVLGPVIYISIRNTIIEDFGENEAGFWEGINRISSFYLLFVSTLLTLYFLPKLSQAKTVEETRSVLWSYYKGIVPVFALGLFIIYFVRKLVINIVLSEEFLPMEDLFIWQLSGDFFKVCFLILGYELLAKKLTRAFIAVEVTSFVVLYISSSYLVTYYGSLGAVIAHTITSFIILILLGVYFRIKFK